MESHTSPETVSREDVEDLLTELAGTGSAKFTLFFRGLRDRFPREAKRVSMHCLARANASQVIINQFIGWLKTIYYFKLLLDPDFLSVTDAARVAELLRAEDPYFFVNFSRLTGKLSDGEDSRSLTRALTLLEGLSDYHVLFPWLRGLTTHDDQHIQSKAAKALCKLKSNTAIVSRQLKSTDARVRANAVEALWHTRSAEVEGIFQNALLDEHHRVVVNALVGLHFQGDTGALSKLLECTNHSNEMYRLAAVWALGYLARPEAIPALQRVLDSDSSQSVRDKALNALTKLASPKGQSAAAA